MTRTTIAVLAIALIFTAACSSGPAEEDDDLPDEAPQEEVEEVDVDDTDSVDDTRADTEADTDDVDPGHFGDSEFIQDLLAAENQYMAWDCRCNAEHYSDPAVTEFDSAEDCIEEVGVDPDDFEGYGQCVVELVQENKPLPQGMDIVNEHTPLILDKWNDCIAELEDTYGTTCTDEAAEHFNTCRELAFETGEAVLETIDSEEFQAWFESIDDDDLRCLPDNF